MPDSQQSEQNVIDVSTRLRQAEVLLGVSRAVAALETLNEVLAALVQITSMEMGAERTTLFLNDSHTGELYSRIAQGTFYREIRMLNTNGVAGHVYTTGKGVVVPDAYADERFNRSIDEQTGFVTKSLLCAPIRTVKGEVIGIAQVLNKQEGQFTEDDLAVLEAMTTQAALALQSTAFVERTQKTRTQEIEFLEVVSDVISELDLAALLQKVMSEATRMLQAERSTLFLNDEKTHELYTVVAQGLDDEPLRLRAGR